MPRMSTTPPTSTNNPGPTAETATGSTSATESVWDENNLHNPHAIPDKARRVREMFSAIATSYDLNNRLHSMWRDQAWRRSAVRMCDVTSSDRVLDVACGTGDLSLAFAAASPERVIGLDFTHEMVQIALTKVPDNADVPITFGDGDAMRLPMVDQTVDVVSIAFGIRNVAEPMRAVHEFYRVLRPGGRLMILEFSLPRNAILRGLYNFYFRHIMPRTATLISGDRSGAYKYLPKSVNTFIGREQLIDMMDQAGFKRIQAKPLTFGIAIAYLGIKE